ncbi:MAG: hypothetical protein M3154_08360 [Candidatus Eremiobacteraeota bacterium]|nr:hypothetical protein [Candidatus Eremiobacteraeota bacterium]
MKFTMKAAPAAATAMMRRADEAAERAYNRLEAWLLALFSGAVIAAYF